MIQIPFYNHYREDSPRGEQLNGAFSEGFYLSEKDCLCQCSLEGKPPAVLVHGSRDITAPCYDRLMEQIHLNRDTHFYILAFSLGFGHPAFEKVKQRIGKLPNYTPVVGFNLKETIEQIEGLHKGVRKI